MAWCSRVIPTPMLSQILLSYAPSWYPSPPPPKPWPTPDVNRPRKCGFYCTLPPPEPLETDEGLTSSYSALPHQHHIVPVLWGAGRGKSREHMLGL